MFSLVALEDQETIYYCGKYVFKVLTTLLNEQCSYMGKSIIRAIFVLLTTVLIRDRLLCSVERKDNKSIKSILFYILFDGSLLNAYNLFQE